MQWTTLSPASRSCAAIASSLRFTPHYDNLLRVLGFSGTRPLSSLLLPSRLRFPFVIANPPRISKLPNSQARAYHLRYIN